jgi:hypothetical protein
MQPTAKKLSTDSPCSPCLRSVFLLVLFAIAVRAGALFVMPNALRTDPDGYRWLAVNMVKFGTFGRGDLPTAYRPPLYPVMLISCVTVHDWQRAAIGVLHVALGAATVFLTFKLAEWWGLRRRSATIAALLVACDPILIAQSSQVMTETAAVFFAVAGLAMLTLAARLQTAKSMFLAGVVLGLGSLCRPSFLPWAILAGAVFLLREWQLKKQKSEKTDECACSSAHFAIPASLFLGLLLTLAPWTIRNQMQFCRPIFMTTHGGYTLLLGNNPSFYAWLRSGSWGSVWSAEGLDNWFFQRPRGEIQADRAAYAEAFKTIQEQPGMFGYACLVRLGRFWTPLPHQTTPTESPRGRLARWMVAAWYLGEFFLAFVGLWRIRGEGREARGERSEQAACGFAIDSPSRESAGLAPGVLEANIARSGVFASPWLFGFLLIAALMASHAFYWTDMRMRAPIMPLVALAAAAGLAKSGRQNFSKT